ncbi:MAG: hypothetical protein HQL95_13870, partial [Magnetococcales bacterium]|nr:hypothetical protein [Magnetococcales bacterium]
MRVRPWVILPWLWALASPVQAETRIGLRFVASQELGRDATKQHAFREKLTAHVVQLNRYYRESQVEMQADIVSVDFAEIASVEATEILADMRQERNGFARLFAAASHWGADFTVAVTGKLTLQGKPGCGRAWAVNQTREAISSTRNALMVYNPVCGAHTLAHELGHLMGLNHGPLVDGCEPGRGHAAAIAPYANGYGVGNCDSKPQPGEFGTIMVGGWMGRVMGNDKASLPLFSNPRIKDPRCGIRQVCGDPQTGDAARTLNENAHLYAAHEEPDVDT